MGINDDRYPSVSINFKLNFLLRYGQSIILILIFLSFFAINEYNYPEFVNGYVVMKKVQNEDLLKNDNFQRNPGGVYLGRMTVSSAVKDKIIIGNYLMIKSENESVKRQFGGKVDSIISSSDLNYSTVYISVIDTALYRQNEKAADVISGVTEIETGQTSLFKKLFKNIADKFTVYR